MQFVDGIPQILSAGVVLNSHSSGSVNVESLRPPIPGDMLIHEVRFDLFGIGRAPNGLDLKPSGGIIACQFKIGSVDLTAGYVPVWNFGHLFDRQLLGERVAWGPQDDLDGSTPIGPKTRVSYRWYPRSPIPVPAGMTLTPQFENRGGQPEGTEVKITYVGQLLTRKLPPRVHVPWVSYFVTTGFPYNETGTAVSGELQLLNPYPVPLILERMTGRIAYLTAATYGFEDYEDRANFSPLFGRAVASHAITVRLDNSKGDSIIPLPVPFRQAFAFGRRSWELDGLIMEPNSFWRLYVQKLVPADGSSLDDTVQCQVGLVASREISSGDLR